MLIITQERSGVLRIPDRALRYTPTDAPAREGLHVVWVLRAGVAVPIPVTLGLDDDSFSELVHGELSESDEIIEGELTSDGRSSRATPQAHLGPGP